jgi:acyl-CoA hydrolase
MHWIDLAGAMAAHRHSRNYVVTASVDHIDFRVPVRVGDLVILRSSVNRVFNTSIKIAVRWNLKFRSCLNVSAQRSGFQIYMKRTSSTAARDWVIV